MKSNWTKTVHDLNVDDATIRISAKTFYALMSTIVIIVGAAVASYVNMGNKIDSYAKESMTVSQFQTFTDEFRERNPNLSIPPVPKKESAKVGFGMAVMSEHQTK